MFELEMFNLLTKTNEIKFNDLSIFEFSEFIDELNELIDNNLNAYSVCLIFYSIWLKEFQNVERYSKWIKWIKFI